MIKKLYCPVCQEEKEICLRESGPHIKASCNECGAYIKFMSQTELTGEKKMSEFEITVDIPNSQYNEIIIVNKYGDRYSLVLGYKGKEGTNGKKWCFPQTKDRKPAEKAVPWGIPLGNKTDAIEVVKKIAEAFGIEMVAF
jgi:hypothetical protein